MSSSSNMLGLAVPQRQAHAAQISWPDEDIGARELPSKVQTKQHPALITSVLTCNAECMLSSKQKVLLQKPCMTMRRWVCRSL